MDNFVSGVVCVSIEIPINSLALHLFSLVSSTSSSSDPPNLLESFYYIVYILTSIITGIIFILFKDWLTSYKANYLYFNFNDKLNILATNYRQIYITASYAVIVMLYIYYLF